MLCLVFSPLQQWPTFSQCSTFTGQTDPAGSSQEFGGGAKCVLKTTKNCEIGTVKNSCLPQNFGMSSPEKNCLSWPASEIVHRRITPPDEPSRAMAKASPAPRSAQADFDRIGHIRLTSHMCDMVITVLDKLFTLCTCHVRPEV